MPRIVCVANKSWECDPIVSVFLADGIDPQPRARPAAYATPTVVRHPVLSRPALPPRPRVTLGLGASSVELWCLQDLVAAAAHSSSSEAKARAVPAIFEGDPPALAIALGTAAHPDPAMPAGSAVAGSVFLVHDAHPGASNPQSGWEPPEPDTLRCTRGVPAGALDRCGKLAAADVENRLLRAPAGAPGEPRLFAGDHLASVGTVNVTDYGEYAAADAKSLLAFEAARKQTGLAVEAASVETTHGIVGLEAIARGIPFVWTSGIANTVGAYDTQVRPYVYAQNLVAAHAAGVAVAWLLPHLASELAIA